jgi:hypothetical protein
MDTSRPDNHEYILWAILACAALHMVEEYAFDWPGWVRSLGVQSSLTDMYVMNLAFFGIGICAALVGWKDPSFSLSFPALVLINALFHIVASLLSWRLNPGTLTAVILFLPVGIRCFVLAARDGVLTKQRAVKAAVTGLLIHAFPILMIALRRQLSY